MSKNFLKKIIERWQTVLILIFMVVAITFSISIFIPAKYSSQTKMIIIQNHQSEEVDAFSAAKSAEYLGNIISNIIFTQSFIDDVFDAPFEAQDNLPSSSEKKMKAWDKKIKVEKKNNTGILTITAFDQSRIEAERLADSISWALNVRGSRYHGGGESVEIKSIDGPITSERPATPNILLNTLLALIVGAIGSVSIVYFFDDFELVLFRKRELGEEIDLEGQNNSAEKIIASLEKIREDLKNQKSNKLVIDDYAIENFENQVEEIPEVEEASIEEDSELIEDFREALFEKELKKAEDEQIEEVKEEIKSEIVKENFKKSAAPRNLPIFKDEEKEETKPELKPEKNNKGFITMEELNQEAQKMGLVDDDKKDSTKYEASSEEVKERLNKLLKGEL